MPLLYERRFIKRAAPLALADTSQKITNSLEHGEDWIMSSPNSDG